MCWKLPALVFFFFLRGTKIIPTLFSHYNKYNEEEGGRQENKQTQTRKQKVAAGAWPACSLQPAKLCSRVGPGQRGAQTSSPAGKRTR